MKVVVITYFQTFTLDRQRSNDQERVITVELSNGKMPGPVSFVVPAFATPLDVDGFIQDLCEFDGTTVCPFTRACLIFTELRGLVASTWSKAEAASQVSQMAHAKEDLESGAQSLRTAAEAVNAEVFASEEALDAGMATRKEALSQAAGKATQAARTTMQVLDELRNSGDMSYQQFYDGSRTASLNAFKLRVLRHAFKSEWFL